MMTSHCDRYAFTAGVMASMSEYDTMKALSRQYEAQSNMYCSFENYSSSVDAKQTAAL